MIKGISFLTLIILWFTFLRESIPQDLHLGTVCRDGWVTYSDGPGICSWHGGATAQSFGYIYHATTIFISSCLAYLMLFKINRS